MIDKIKAFVDKVIALWRRLPNGKYVAAAGLLVVLSIFGKVFGVAAAAILLYLAARKLWP